MRVLMMGITPPVEGGSERHIYELNKRIEDSYVLTQLGSICNRKIVLPIMTGNNFLKMMSMAITYFLYSLYLLARKKHDIIHIHENVLYFLAPILKLRYKVIITIHGIYGFRFYDDKRLWPIFRFFLKFADLLVAVSLRDKKGLEKEFSKVKYIPNGVDIGIYTRVKEKIENKILFVGRIHEQKGISYLLDAFTKVKGKIKLEIVGKINDYALELKNKYPDARISWEGYIGDRDELVKKMKSSYCIAIPSLWEGLPLVLFEALASGRPVITTSIPALKSVIKPEEVIFVKPKDSEGIRKAVEFLFKNKKEAEKIGIRGLWKAKKYDWNIISRELERTYASVLK